MKKLFIDLETLPEEGKVFAGELDGEIFDIDGTDLKSIGPLVYDLHVQRFEGELFIAGKISALFSFCCVRCLDWFPMTIKNDNFSASVEIREQKNVELAEVIREELIIDFPMYPKCEDSDEEKSCNAKSTHFGVDKEGQTGVNSSAPKGNSGVWDALDALGD